MAISARVRAAGQGTAALVVADARSGGPVVPHSTVRMTRSIRLRPWQKAALDGFVEARRPDFLAVATPGAGKTTFALTAARHRLAIRPGRLIVVAPTPPEAPVGPGRVPLRAAPRPGVGRGRRQAARRHARHRHHLPAGGHQRAGAAPPLARLVRHLRRAPPRRRRPGLGRRRAPGLRGRRPAPGPVGHAVPLRHPAIPFVDYHLDEARPDYEYGYGDALRDRRVVRPVYFPRINGQMEWSAPDGSEQSATFDDDLDAARSSQRLRTALSLEGEWLPTVLDRPTCGSWRPGPSSPTPGGWSSPRTRSTPGASPSSCAAARHPGHRRDLRRPPRLDEDRRLRRRDQPWIVAVRMVSEGVDIPRLRVGVYATTTTTELFFRQAVGRLVRWTRGVPRQKAFLFIPDDPRLRRLAHGIAEQRRHSLARRERPTDHDGLEDAAALDDEPAEEQMSLFAVISAVATDADGEADPEDEGLDDDDGDGDGFDLELGPPPPLAGVGGAGGRRRQPDHPAGGQEAPARPQRRAGPRPGPHHRLVPRPGQPGAQPHRRGHPGHRGHRGPAAHPAGEGHPVAGPLGLSCVLTRHR